MARASPMSARISATGPSSRATAASRTRSTSISLGRNTSSRTFGTYVCRYSDGSLYTYRVAAILGCMEQAKPLAAVRAARVARYPHEAAWGRGHGGSHGRWRGSLRGDWRVEATPGIEPGYTVLQTVA